MHPVKQPHPSSEYFARLAQFYSLNLLLSSLVSLLVTVLVLSEIAYHVSTHYPKIESNLLSRILFARDHVNPLGLILIVSTLIIPVVTLAQR